MNMKDEFRLRFYQKSAYLDLVSELLTLTLLHLAGLVDVGLHNLFCLFGAEVRLRLSLFLLDVSLFSHNL